MNITTQALQTMIRSKSKELGFTACGFARYEVLEDESVKLRKWLDAGMQADMAWIEKGFDKRRDIRNIIPEAKSVISLAFNYYTPFEHDEDKPKISRYAWGKDYHKVLKKKMKALCEVIMTSPLYESSTSKSHRAVPVDSKMFKTSPNPLLGKEGALEKTPPQPTPEGRVFNNSILLKFYVDDGPVMDKVWAKKAGLGWMGKHTNIINLDFGSWFFICSIITNIEFESYDSPVEDMCGSCSLCISACPTGAITDEYVVDANKCISYQTIENRGDIPSELNLDGWIFGCDVCQDVCPYNSPKYNHVTGEDDFFPKKIIGSDNSASTTLSATKNELRLIAEEEFNEIFVDSPIKRTKYNGWKRNLERI